MSIGSFFYNEQGSRSASLYITINNLLLDSSIIMAQILDPLPNDENGYILCCYVNATSQIQVARITNISNWYFERVVFPGQRLVFEAQPQAILEIHSGMMASSILSDTIPCQRLALQAPLTKASQNPKPQVDSEKVKADPETNSSNERAAASPFNVAV